MSAVPVANLPGPANRLPGDLLWSLLNDRLNFLSRTARRYGDVVPFRPWRYLFLLVNDPEVIREVLVTKDEHFMKGPALRRVRVIGAAPLQAGRPPTPVSLQRP